MSVGATITIDMDKRCVECGRRGAGDNGFCLSCVSKAISGATMKTAIGRSLQARIKEQVRSYREKTPMTAPPLVVDLEEIREWSVNDAQTRRYLHDLCDVVEQLVEALRRHGDHETSCPAYEEDQWGHPLGWRDSDVEKCTCRLGTSLSLVRLPQKESTSEIAEKIMLTEFNKGE